MELKKMPLFERQYKKWLKTNMRNCDRIDILIHDIMLNPFAGKGKPEKLVGERDIYSRRITQEHRLIYAVTCGTVSLVSCHGHYKKQ